MKPHPEELSVCVCAKLLRKRGDVGYLWWEPSKWWRRKLIQRSLIAGSSHVIGPFSGNRIFCPLPLSLSPVIPENNLVSFWEGRCFCILCWNRKMGWCNNVTLIKHRMCLEQCPSEFLALLDAGRGGWVSEFLTGSDEGNTHAMGRWEAERWQDAVTVMPAHVSSRCNIWCDFRNNETDAFLQDDGTGIFPKSGLCRLSWRIGRTTSDVHHIAPDTSVSRSEMHFFCRWLRCDSVAFEKPPEMPVINLKDLRVVLVHSKRSNLWCSHRIHSEVFPKKHLTVFDNKVTFWKKQNTKKSGLNNEVARNHGFLGQHGKADWDRLMMRVYAQEYIIGLKRAVCNLNPCPPNPPLSSDRFLIIAHWWATCWSVRSSSSRSRRVSSCSTRHAFYITH